MPPAGATTNSRKRVYSFVIGDELIPGSRPMLTRRVFTLQRPIIQKMLTEHQFLTVERLIKPEKWGIQPTLLEWPTDQWSMQPGEFISNHIKNIKPSPFISASTWSDGAPEYEGRLVFINRKNVIASGSELLSTSDIRNDLEYLKSQTKDPSEIAKIDDLIWKSIIRDREVLIRGNIPNNAIHSEMTMNVVGVVRVLYVVGIAVSIYDLYEAGEESTMKHSGRPLIKEGIHQIAGWGGAALGAKIFATGATVAGVEAGPFDVIFGVLGGFVGGAIGYFSSDLIIRHCPDWILKRVR